jgi:hypothetical protein
MNMNLYSLKFAKFASLAAVTAVLLAGCTNPLESEQPFASMDVPVEAAEYNCSPPQGKEPGSVTGEVAIIAAPTNTFVRFSNALSTAELDIRKLLDEDGVQVSTVLANGSPIQTSRSWVDFSKAVFQADKDKAVNRALGKVRMTYYCAVMTQSQNPTAYAPIEGADFLGALQVAASSFTHASASHEIVVLGNGLQDIGQLDLANGLPQDASSARSVANTLQNSGSLPDLTDVTVRWYGLGQNDRSNQEPLHPVAAKGLEILWTEIIEAAGGQLVKVVRTVPYADPVSTSISATPIDVPAPPCVFMLTSDDGFNFKPDSASFLDASKAQNGAENMAAEIKRSGCDGPLYVVGYAASGLDKKLYNSAAISAVKSVSAARASAFKSLLEKAGVKIQLIPVGAGKGPTNDWDEDGKFSEDMGKQNRFVEVTQSKPEVD